MNQFNIRVYGICINEQNEILVSKEQHKGLHFTKFPGGGLEFGEGTIDCLKREFLEEFDIEIEVGELFYFTDSFQRSAFSKTEQLIAIYYRFQLKENVGFKDALFKKRENNEEQLLWVTSNNFNDTLFHFPIDQKVALLIRESLL